MAGESADSSARRMRERADRLHRAADKWERGAEGERRTAEALAGLPAHEWTVFHDVPWPGRPRANVDHVAVGPTGIFVIDSKHWSGSVTVRDGVLRQNGYRRDKTVSGAVDAASAMASLLPAVGRADVHPMVCFVRDEPFATASVGDVVLTSAAQLVRHLVDLPVAFTPEGRETIAWELELRLYRNSPRSRPMVPQPRARRRPRSRPSGRSPKKQGLVASIVGAALAIGVLGVALSHPEVFERFGHAFVSLVGNDTEQLPADEPADKPKKGDPKRDRQSD